MGLHVSITAVVAGPNKLAVPIAEPGANLGFDDHHLQGLLEAFATHPKAPEVDLDWLDDMIDADTLHRAKVESATPVRRALKAVRKLHDTVAKSKTGYRDRYELWYTGRDGKSFAFWPAEVNRDGRLVALRFGWDECVEAQPGRKGRVISDLRKSEPFTCTFNESTLTLRVVHRTFADLYSKDLQALLRLCEIAEAHRGFVQVAAA